MTTNRLGTPTTEPISYPTAQPTGGATRSSESVQPSHGRTDGRTDEEDGHLGISGSRNASPAGGPQNSPRITPTDTPKRIQLRRTKGWRKPEGAVVVARPSRWGNPFRVERIECDAPAGGMCQRVTTPDGRTWAEHLDSPRGAHRMAVDLFELHIGPMGSYEYDDDTLGRLRSQLAGRDLACWCKLGDPCHADVLLELANGSLR